MEQCRCGTIEAPFEDIADDGTHWEHVASRRHLTDSESAGATCHVHPTRCSTYNAYVLLRRAVHQLDSMFAGLCRCVVYILVFQIIIIVHAQALQLLSSQTTPPSTRLPGRLLNPSESCFLKFFVSHRRELQVGS